MKNIFKKYNHFPNKIDQFRKFDRLLEFEKEKAEFLKELKKFNKKYTLKDRAFSFSFDNGLIVSNSEYGTEIINDELGNKIEVTGTGTK